MDQFSLIHFVLLVTINNKIPNRYYHQYFRRSVLQEMQREYPVDFMGAYDSR